MGKMPRHVAIIMDGNGRWAKERGLPRIGGHARGVEVTDTIVTAAAELGVSFLTLYAFSDENWNRPADEVAALMQLLRQYLVIKREKMIREQIRLTVIGDVERLPVEVRQEIAATREATAKGSRMTLVLALSYGARGEILRAVQRLLEQMAKKVPSPLMGEGQGGGDTISADDFSAVLDTAGIPDPDLLIRTSGEQRVSNFLLWQLAYTELYFTETLWPDFGRADLEKAIEEYGQRERRFGKTSEQVARTRDPSRSSG